MSTFKNEENDTNVTVWFTDLLFLNDIRLKTVPIAATELSMNGLQVSQCRRNVVHRRIL